MLNKTLSFILFLSFSISSYSQTNNKIDDEISTLLKRVDLSKQDAQIENMEKQLLGRASWKIKCRSKGYENNDVCIMQKGPISIIKINNIYTISQGEKHTKNSISYLQIDNNEAVMAREGLYRNAEPIIIQFKQGLMAFSRYSNQNLHETINNQISLIGFTAALNDMEAQYQQLNKEH